MSPYAPLVAIGLLLAAGAGGWFAGDHHGAAVVQAKWDKATVKTQAAVIKQDTTVHAATVAQASDAQAQGVQIVHDVEVIHDKAKQVLVKVPVYVPVSADRACTVNVGFVRLWNAANVVGAVAEPGSAGGGQQPASEAGGAGGLSTAKPFSLGQ